MKAVLRLKKNLVGRDFAVGDIHGCFSLLEQALEEAVFDPKKDRVICVGDLVNRGPESERALEFLKKEYFFTVRGNHEHAIRKDIERINQEGKAAVSDEYRKYGLGWLLALDNKEQAELIDTFENLPYAIEVPLKTGDIVGFTHAEIPKGLSWQDFTKKLEAGDERVQQTALFGRSRIIQAHKDGFDTESGVPGIKKVFTGHSIAGDRRAIKMGNWFCIDTGAVTRYIGIEPMAPKSDPKDLHLSLVDIQAEANEINRVKPRDDNRPYHIIHAPVPRL